MWNTLSRVLSFAAVGLVAIGVALGIYSSSHPPTPSGAMLVVKAPQRDIGEQPVGTNVELDYLVTNESDRPLRIVGFAGGGGG